MSLSEKIVMLVRRVGSLSLATALLASVGQQDSNGAVPPTAENPWRAVHLNNYETDKRLDGLAEQLPQLAKLGVNCLILEVDYGFCFQSHPELRRGDKSITKAGAKRFVS